MRWILIAGVLAATAGCPAPDPRADEGLDAKFDRVLKEPASDGGVTRFNEKTGEWDKTETVKMLHEREDETATELEETRERLEKKYEDRFPAR